MKRLSTAGSAVCHAVVWITALSLSAPMASARLQKAQVRLSDDPGCKSCVSTAASLFARGQTTQASELLRSWSGKCPNTAQLHLLLSTIALRSGNKQESESEASLACAASPSSVAAHLQCALAMMSNNHQQQAISQFKRVTELDPGSYEAWSALSSLYMQTHEDQEAARCAARAAALEPATRASKLAIVSNLKRAGKYQQAGEEIKRLLSSDDLAPESAQDLAKEALLVGAFDQANAACARVSAAYPNAPAPRIMSALSNYCAGRYEDCLASADKVLARDSHNPDALALKCLALAKQSKLEQAQALQKSIDEGSALSLLSKGTVQFLSGDNEACEETLHQCLEQDASNTSMQGLPHTLAHIALAELYKKSGKSLLAAEETHAVLSDKRFPALAAELQK